MREIEVSADELATAFGVTPRTLRKLADRGLAKRAGRGRYLFFESCGLYLAHLHEAAEGRGGEVGVSNLTDERARLAKEQAEGLALKNAAIRNSMIPVAEAEAAWQDVMHGLNARMQSIPARVSRKLGHLTEHDVSVMDDEIRLALTALAPPR